MSPALAHFIIHESGRPPRAWRIAGLKAVIGRENGCDLVLPNTSVSRRHATIEVVGSSYTITDLGSQNGTLINGQELRQKLLKTHDKVQLGRYVLDFQGDEMDTTIARLGTDQLKEYMVGRNAVALESTMNVSATDLSRFVDALDAKFRAVVVDLDDAKRVWKPGGKPLVFGSGGVDVKGIGAGAELSWNGSAHTVRKTGWLAGVRINGKKVDSGALKNGDEFQVGSSRFKYELEK